MRRSRLCSCLTVAALAVSGAHAQTVLDVFPLEPQSGGTVGPKPMLAVGVDGTDPGKMFFRIEMSRDDFESVAYTFDQQKDANGWVYTALGGENGAIYRVRKPIDNGVYTWRAWAWNGTDWVQGKKRFQLRVDGIPPADVKVVRMRVDRKKKAILLDWDPVTTDQEGRSEYVARYKVYRYDRRSMFFVIRPFEIGTTEKTHFEDPSDKAMLTALVFYKVTAEDEAGNEPERRY